MMVEVCARQHLMCVGGSKSNVWAGWFTDVKSRFLRLRWARWEMRVGVLWKQRLK